MVRRCLTEFFRPVSPSPQSSAGYRRRTAASELSCVRALAVAAASCQTTAARDKVCPSNVRSQVIKLANIYIRISIIQSQWMAALQIAILQQQFGRDLGSVAAY
jgi:hypothetical protein